ncbi:MAG: glycosyl hydrolase [Tepidisphaeraceae bacterium]
MRNSILASCLAVLSTVAAAAPDLDQGFASPPDAARPQIYWFVMDGNFNREGITADLEAIKRVGLGGVLFMEVDVGIPRGPVKFMSPPWRELFKHANQEAARLGLEITMPASPGWTGSGGPWVKPEQSMQKLVFSETAVAGPRKFDAVLPEPPTIAGYYRDVAVQAFPTSPQAYGIEDIQEKALYHRGHFSSEGGVKQLLPMTARHAVLLPGQIVSSKQIVDLSGKLDANGRLAWDVPDGNWTIMRFGHTSTGANTRPAPQPGLGLECDKLDKAALKAHFDDFLGKLVADLGPLTGKSLVSLHIDSWEMGPQNWTGRFPEEFQKRRGYSPIRYLPVMTGRVIDSLEISERFLWDLRQTVLELITENHSGYLAELARQRGMRLSIEPYDGTPCDDMTYGSRADVPMGEFWHDTFNTWFSCAEASSLGHTYGKPIIQAEAYTSGSGERWLAHPASLKALGDWAFCEGINRFVFHRCAHQPWLDRFPGMTMGPYGIHYERTQTWWDQSTAWIQYLTRCQFLLQQGLFVADIAYLNPEASPHVFRQPASAVRGTPPERLGYSFDSLTPEALLTRVSVRDGRLVLPDGMSYRILVLPKFQTMTPAVLRKIRDLVTAGATVVGPRPLKSPSLTGYPKCDDEVKQLAGELWGDGELPDAVVSSQHGEGQVVTSKAFIEITTGAADPKAGLGKAKWIWHKEGNPAVRAPVATRYFRRLIDIDAAKRIESARVAMTADNSFELSVNARPAGSGDNFHEVVERDIAALLKPGTNTFAVVAVNGGDAPNPAGLIGNTSIRFSDGSTLEIPTDATWESATTSTDQWQPAMELGLVGMAPWGLPGRPVTPADIYPDYSLLSELLAKGGLPPDFASDTPLRCIHRHDRNTEIYFVSNGQPAAVSANCTFRISGRLPEIWDPITGGKRLASAFAQNAGRTTVPLELEPSGSLFVIFRKPTDVKQATGRNFPEFKPLQVLPGPWAVRFDPKWGGPESVTFETLADWSKRPEDGIRHYSGTAIYTKTFTAPVVRDQRLYLNLGQVEVMAQITLNGKGLGIVWKPPYRVDITDAVKPDENALELRVVNLWPNRLIGDQSLPEAKQFTRTTWNPFKKDSPLLPSGLLGPVTIQAAN